MYSVKKQKSSIKALLISTVLFLLSCVFFITSCPTGGASEIYKLELNGGSGDGYTTAIYYSPVDKAWFSDPEGKNEITKVPSVPSGNYTVTLLWNNSAIQDKVGTEYYRQTPVTRKFLGYKVNSLHWIDEEGNINPNFSISRSTTATAAYDDAINYTFPTIVEVNERINGDSAINTLGYEFLGWSQMKEWTSSVSDRGSVPITGNSTFYATYRYNGIYTLTIDWKGETDANAIKTVYYKPNMGWYKDQALEDVLSTITIPKKVWTVEFNKNINGESNPATQTIEWNLKNLGGENDSYLDVRTGAWNTQKQISSNITINAEWETSKSIIFEPVTLPSGYEFIKWVIPADEEVDVSGEKLDPLTVEDYVRNGKLSFLVKWRNNNFANIHIDSNGATTEQPSILYYSLREDAEKKWHKEIGDEGIDDEGIVPPSKVWTVEFDTGYSDVDDPEQLLSEWTFDGYYYSDGRTTTQWIDNSGAFLSDIVLPTSENINLVASWINQTVIEELPQVSRPGMIFKGWSLSKDKNSAILPSSEYTPKSEKTVLYAQWDNVSYSVDFTEESYGIYAKPISGIKNILLDSDVNVISLRLTSSNEDEVPQFDVDKINNDVSGWFTSSAFSNALINAKYIVKGYSDDYSMIYIGVEGALSESPNGVIGANKNDQTNMGVRVPLTAIKNSYNVGTISPRTPIYYEVVGEVRATLEDGLKEDANGKTERYYGTENNPIVGNPGVSLGENGNGVLIRVKVENAKLRDELKPDDVKKWFKPINVWFTNENITDVSIDTSASYSETDNASYITLRLKGTVSAEITSRKTTILAIPYSDLVDGYASKETVEHDPYIYYRSEKTPQIVVDSTQPFKGSAMYPFVATPYVKIGESGEGYTIRVILEGRTFTNSALVGDSNVENNVVKGWFTSNSITSGDSFGSIFGDSVEYKVLSGGNGAKYVDVGISGFTTHAPQQQANAYFSIPNSDIGLQEEGSQEITISYVITNPVEVVVDTAPPYRGGDADLDKRLRVPYYINMGNGNGERIRLNVNNGYFSQSLQLRQDVKSWITAPDDFDMSNITFTVSDIGSDRSYIIVSANGYGTSIEAKVGELKFNVPNTAISFAEEHLEVPEGTLHYFSGIKITASLTNARDSYYYGGLDNPLKAIPYTYLGRNGEGVQIEVNLNESEGYDFVFADNLPNDEIKKWFTTEGDNASLTVDENKSFNGRVGGDSLEYSYVSGAGTKSVIVTIKSYLTTPGITFTPKIRIPYSSVKGATTSLPNTETDFCITSTAEIKVVLSDKAVPGTDYDDVAGHHEERYRGSAEQRLYGNSSMWLNSGFMGDGDAYGLPMRIELNNAIWANDLTANDIKSWFEFKPFSYDSLTEPMIQEYSIEIKDFPDNNGNVEPGNGKKGESFVTFLLKGYYSAHAYNGNQVEGTEPKDAHNVLSIDPRYFQNVSSEILESSTKAAVFTTIDPTILTVEVAAKLGSVGTEIGPIVGAENIWLGDDGEGVKVILRVSEGTGAYIIFADDLTTSQVEGWLKNGLTQLEPSSIKVSDIAFVALPDAGIPDADVHRAIEFTLKGYFKKGSFVDSNPTDGTALRNEIILDYRAFANSTPSFDDVPAFVYTRSLGPVKLTLGTGEGYVGGTSDKPIVGTPYIKYGFNVNDANAQDGVRVELRLENATFTTRLSDALVTMFQDLTRAVNGDIEYEIVEEEGAGPGTNRAIILITGFPRIPNITDGQFELNLPSSCINAAIEDIVVDPVTVYYKTNPLEEITVSADDGFSGSVNKPLGMTPYVKLGENGDGIKVRLTLKENKFVDTLTAENVRSWFNAFENAIGFEEVEGVENVYPYTIEGQGTKNLDITIKGYATNSNVTSSVNITIPRIYIDGTADSFGDKQATLYYSITTPVSITIEDGIYQDANGVQKQYYGTSVSPIRTVKNVVYGNGDGVRMRLRINNATFSDEVRTVSDTYDINSWFKDAPATRKYRIVNVISDDLIEIEVSGYDNNDNSGSYQYKVSLPDNAIKNAAQSIVSGNRTINRDLYFICLGNGNAEISNSALYNGGELYPIKGRKYMMLTRGSNETLGARIRIELSNLLFTALPEDNNLTDLGWFNDFKAKYGDNFTFTRVDGGNDESYVVVEVNGYPTTNAGDKGSATISIPKTNIKGTSDEFEEKSFPIYYDTDTDVIVSLSTDSAFVGGSENNPLGNNLVKYVEFNNGNGVEVRVELKNAKFNENVMNGNDNISDDFALLLVANLPSTFKGENGEDHPRVEYVAGGYVKDDNNRDNYYDFIRFKLHGYVDNNTLELVTNEINIPYKYLKNGGPVDDESKLIKALWYCQTTDIKSVSATVTVGGAYYGSESQPIEGRSNALLGGNDDGVNVRIQLVGAQFSDVITGILADDPTRSHNVKLWFSDLNAEWGGNLTYTLVTQSGTGKETNYAIVNIKGAPVFTDIRDGKNITLHIPGNHIFKAHFPTTGDTENVTTPFYYNNKENVAIAIDSSSSYVGGSASNPFTATPYINVPSNTFVRVSLNAQELSFREGISSDDVTRWFTLANDALGGALTFDVQGQGRNYVVVKIGGYIANPDTTSSFNISVPYSDVVGVNENAGSFTALMYYSTTGVVSADVGYTSTVAQQRYIQGYQNIYLNRNNGFTIRITLTNAKWRVDLAQNPNLIASIFANMETSGFHLAGASYSLNSVSTDRSYIEVTVKGYPTTLTNNSEVDVNIGISPDCLDNANEALGSVGATVRVKSEVDLITLDSSDGQGSPRYGAENNPIVGTARLRLLTSSGSSENVYIMRLRSNQARFIANITDVRPWMVAVDEYGRENAGETSSLTYNVAGEAPDGSWIDISINGSFAREINNEKIAIRVPTSALRYYAQTETLNSNLTPTFNIAPAPTFTITNNTLKYAQYERLEDAIVPSDINKRFEVKIEGAKFVTGASAEIMSNQVVSDNTKFRINVLNETTAYIYATGRFDSAFNNAPITFTIPRSVVERSADNFAITTIGTSLIDTSEKSAYFAVNENIVVESSAIDLATVRLANHIHTGETAFASHGTTSLHISQTMNFYKLQQARVPYTTGNPSPVENTLLPYDYEIADIEVSSGVYLAVLHWAVDNGYTFYDKAITGSGPASDAELFGFTYASDGKLTNRASTIDPVAGYLTSYRNAVLFCNAFTEYWNARKSLTGNNALKPVYVNGSNVIRDYRNIGYPTDTIIASGNNGFRLPSIAEWQYAAAVSRDKLDSGFRPYNGTASLPDLVYAQSYESPSGYPSLSSDTSVVLANYIIYNGNYGPGSQSTDKGSQGVGNYVSSVSRRANLLGLYDMSGNVAEWTCTDAGDSTRYVVGGHVGSDESDVAVGSFQKQSVNDVSSITGYNTPVGIRLVRSLT